MSMAQHNTWRKRMGTLLGRRRRRRRTGPHRPIGHIVPLLETLEDRRVLSVASLSVTTTEDVVDPDDGLISLREAITQANQASEDYEIVLQSGSTYTLSLLGQGEDANLSGDLDIDSTAGNLTIRTAGEGLATIDADGVDRVFHVVGSGTATVELVNLVLTGGLYGHNGGGIFIDGGELELADSLFRDNWAGRDGGALTGRNDPQVTIVGSTLADNRAGDYGGAIDHRHGELAIVNSTLSGNAAADDGGAIRQRDANGLLLASTISDNTSGDMGGGVDYRRGELVIINSTISGNRAAFPDGGISQQDGELVLNNSTVAHNYSRLDGGGIRNREDGDGLLVLHNTLVAGNTAEGGGPDLHGQVVGEHNLVGDGSGSQGLIDGEDNNQVGDSSSPIDPLLGLLAHYGGPTFTHALLPGSPAIDAGDPVLFPETDQRGIARPQGPAPDIGAFERSVHLLVTTTADSGPGSLREAIEQANADPGLDTIVFDIPQSDPRHFYYQDDGVDGRVSASRIAVTTTADASVIGDIDPDWPHTWFSIQLETPLPASTEPIIVDGYTQPGAAPNTNPVKSNPVPEDAHGMLGLNTVLKIELNAGKADFGTEDEVALKILAGDSTLSARTSPARPSWATRQAESSLVARTTWSEAPVHNLRAFWETPDPTRRSIRPRRIGSPFKRSGSGSKARRTPFWTIRSIPTVNRGLWFTARTTTSVATRYSTTVPVWWSWRAAAMPFFRTRFPGMHRAWASTWGATGSRPTTRWTRIPGPTTCKTFPC